MSRCEFQCERHPIELATDGLHGISGVGEQIHTRPGCCCTLGEQQHSITRCVVHVLCLKPFEQEPLLPRDAERTPTRSEDRESRRATKQSTNNVAEPLNEVFAVVEHKKRSTAPERLRHLIDCLP